MPEILPLFNGIANNRGHSRGHLIAWAVGIERLPEVSAVLETPETQK